MVALGDERAIEKGRVGPGQMIALDLQEARFYRDHEIKDELAAAKPYEKWVKNVTEVEPLITGGPEPRHFTGTDLRQRQLMAGLTVEDLELILHPMAEEGKEAVGSMGDDTPFAVLSERYRPLSHFFRQNFSQVDEPADRSVARIPRDEPDDAVPQSRQHAGGRRDADQGLHARKPGALEWHVRAPARGDGKRD